MTRKNDKETCQRDKYYIGTVNEIYSRCMTFKVFND